ncbi:MAG TPA: 2-dehydropantoate 2-reductase N-terminal domain-containing protein, partial [Paraburkholderia sp.]|nr:2-dehydropantoate 2-reductase N-terminal domain-containing protein [Paraburkholderia sp.]
MAKICIYGAGSIGCYVGGRLLAGGSDITFIARERIGSQLRRHGLTLSQFGERRWSVSPDRIDVTADFTAAA